MSACILSGSPSIAVAVCVYVCLYCISVSESVQFIPSQFKIWHLHHKLDPRGFLFANLLDHLYNLMMDPLPQLSLWSCLFSFTSKSVNIEQNWHAHINRGWSHCPHSGCYCEGEVECLVAPGLVQQWPCQGSRLLIVNQSPAGCSSQAG